MLSRPASDVKIALDTEQSFRLSAVVVPDVDMHDPIALNKGRQPVIQSLALQQSLEVHRWLTAGQ